MGVLGMLEGPLLERERELACLQALLEAARDGRGGVAVIEGDAGVGKSRLLLAARASADAAGMRVLTARGSELEEKLTFGAARQLLGDSGSTDGAAPDAGAGREGPKESRALHDELLSLVRAVENLPAGTPVLMTVDDAQWVDGASLRLLAYLALRIEDRPVAIVATVRCGEASSSSELLHRLREAPSSRVLTPQVLTEAAVGILARAALGEVDPAVGAACFRATGGNPFYLHELLRVLAAEGRAPDADRVSEAAPRAVVRSVGARLARLGEEPSRLARAAAILGAGASLRLTAALAELEEGEAEGAADALAAAGILERGEPLQFLHPLIASALEADMGTFERARRHRRAGDLLLGDGAPVERVAAHFLIARPQGDPSVVAVLREGAALAAARGAPGVAARLLGRALQEPPAPEDETELLLASAKAEALAGSPAAADRLEAALVGMEARDRRTEALVELATLAHHRGDYARAANVVVRARAELPTTTRRGEQLLAIELAAGTLRPDLVSDIPSRLAPVLARARAGDLPADTRMLALVIAWMAATDPPRAVRALAEAAIASDPLIDDSHGMSLGWIAAALGWIDELDLAERWLDDAAAAARRRGAVITGAIAALHRATVRRHLGRLDAALADGERALEIHRCGWTGSPWSTPVLAGTQVAMGKLDAARETIAIGRRAGSDPPDHVLLLEAQTRLELAEGNPAAALVSALSAGDEVQGRYRHVQPRIWEWRRLAALAAHEVGDEDRARELIDSDLQSLRPVGPARQLAASLTVAGRIAGGQQGLDLMTEAASVLETSPARLQRAETLLALGGALRRAGRRTAAKEPLYAALELGGEIGAVPLERQARDELVRLGLRPRRAARSGLGSLTPSERRVAELAAEGLTTPQIAYQLHVTRNTVETHLGRTYRKLGLSGRGKLGDALGERSERAGSNV
jgi:DNA-binding CsgD family transcriptional regulator